MAKETTEKKLYDLLVTRDYDNFQAIDSRTGKTPVNPENGAQDVSKADMFTFDWSSSRGKNYGTAVILLTPEHELELYFGDNLGKTIEDPADKDEWFAFMEQLRHFATRTNFNGFRPLNINQLRHSLQGQAAIKEGLFESWQGRRNMSWSAGPTEARLMIKHKRNLDETDARHHYIESLFIETAESERYKLKFNSLTAGRAMLEHVRQGGRPYDARGQHISDIVEELNVLSRFERSVARDTILEGDTAQLVQEAAAYRSTLKSSLKRLGTGRGYAEYFESWNPVDLTEQDVVIESLKHMFVKQTLDARIEQALPLLARIQQQGNAMKEANIFEAWANRLVEGTWSMPDTPEAQQKLLDFMSREQPVGADATDATEQLYDLLGDDELFDQLTELANQDPNSDCRQLVLDRMQELSDNPDVRAVLEKLNIDADATMNPPESLPADLGDQEVDEGIGDWMGKMANKAFGPGSPTEIAGFASDKDYAQHYDTKAYPAAIQAIAQGGGVGSTLTPNRNTNAEVARAKSQLAHIYRAKGVKIDPSNFDELITNKIKADVAKAMGQQGVTESLQNPAQEQINQILRSQAPNGNYEDDRYLDWIIGPESIQRLVQQTKLPLNQVRNYVTAFCQNPNPEGVAEGKANNDLRDNVLAVLTNIYNGSVAGEYMIDDIADELNDYFDQVQQSNDPILQKAYSFMVDNGQEAEDNPKLMARIAQKAISLLSQQGVAEEDVIAEDAIRSLRRAAGLTENVLRDSTGSTLDHIADKYKRDIKDFEATGNLSDDLFDALYDYYQDDMPYGVQKARSGDPHEWIADRITHDLGLESTSLSPWEQFKLRNNAARSKAGMEPNPDFQEEREPHSVDGGMDNALLYDDAVCNMSETGEHCPVHGVQECWGAMANEGILGTIAGGVAGAALGGLPGAALGGIAGHYLTKDETDEGTDSDNIKNSAVGGLAWGAGATAAQAALGALEEKSGSEETDEGIVGGLAGGALGGIATKSLKGASAGATLGSAIQDRLGKKDDTSPLAGQYGHPGKMTEVGKDTSWLDRLKELSGMKQS